MRCSGAPGRAIGASAWFALAILLLAWAPASEAARRAYLGDVEASNADASRDQPRASGRRLQQDVDVQAVADYDVFDLLDYAYDSSIGAYGGIGVYGYYGMFYGLYGSYGDNYLVDYDMAFYENIVEGEIFNEGPEPVPARGRKLLHAEDKPQQPKQKPPPEEEASVLAFEYDFDQEEFALAGGAYGLYFGGAYGIYYGGYGGYYGGGEYDDDGTDLLAGDLLAEVVHEEAQAALHDAVRQDQPLVVPGH